MADIDGRVTVHGFLIDDQVGDRSIYSDLLSSSELIVTPLQPLEQVETVDEIERQIRREDPTLVILDYRLDEDPTIRYRGGSLAAALRDRFADIPLVLLTTEAKLESLEQHAGVEDLFDWRVLKGAVPGGAVDVRRRLWDMSTSYWRLAVDPEWTELEGWDRVAASLGARSDRVAELAQAETFDPTRASPAQIGRWVLRVLLANPGPLVDAAQARIICGIDRESFVADEVQELLVPTRYGGILSSFEERYWAPELRRLVGDAVGSHGPTPSSDRAAALSRLTGVECKGATCVWCGSERTIRACWRCEEPVDATHALPLVRGPVSEWADQRVACFRCISDGRVEKAALARGVDSIVDSLVSGELTSPLEEE